MAEERGVSRGFFLGSCPPNQVGAYYDHYAIESAFKKAMNLDTMAVVHFAISACKWRRAECSAGRNVAEHIKLSKLDGNPG